MVITQFFPDEAPAVPPRPRVTHSEGYTAVPNCAQFNSSSAEPSAPPASFTSHLLSSPEPPPAAVMDGLREVCAGLPGVTDAYLVRRAVTHADGTEEQHVGLHLVAPPLRTEPTPPEHWAALADTIAAVHRAASGLGYPLGEVGYVAEAGLPITRKRGLRVL